MDLSNKFSIDGLLKVGGPLADVTFVTADSKTFECHRVLFAARSSVFKNLLFDRKEQKLSITIPSASFALILPHFYGTEVRLQSTSVFDVLPLVAFCQEYQLSDLLKFITQFVLGNIRPSSVQNIYQVALKTNIRDIAQACALFGEWNFHEVFGKGSDVSGLINCITPTWDSKGKSDEVTIKSDRSAEVKKHHTVKSVEVFDEKSSRCRIRIKVIRRDCCGYFGLIRPDHDVNKGMTGDSLVKADGFIANDHVTIDLDMRQKIFAIYKNATWMKGGVITESSLVVGVDLDGGEVMFVTAGILEQR